MIPVGLLATAILNMDGVRGISGWKWIFVSCYGYHHRQTVALIDSNHTLQILEGIATCVTGIIAFVFLPRDLSSAQFLTEEERAFAGTTHGLCILLSQRVSRLS